MGGSQNQAQHLIAALHKRHNARIRYFTARMAGEPSYEDHTVEAVGRAGAHRRYGHFWDYVHLQRSLAAFSPDLIYQRVNCAYTGIALRYARKTGTPFVWHLANDNDAQKRKFTPRDVARPHRFVEGYLASRGPRYANFIVAQTQHQSDMLEQNFGRAADAVIRNFQPIPIPAERKETGFRILWVANLKDLKRPTMFLELAERFADLPDVHFEMIGAPYGEARRRREFEQRLASVPNVEFLGARPQHEVYERMRESSVLVNTSVGEGFANTFIQAWMYGLPVFSCGVDPDGLINAQGLGQSCRSVDEMADQIKRLVDEPSLLSALSRKCRQFAAVNFSMENCNRLADTLIELACREHEIAPHVRRGAI